MTPRLAKVKVYKADDGWRWAFLRNGKVRADGGQGYTRHIDCMAGMCDSLGIDDSHGRELYRHHANGSVETIRLDDGGAA
jgi:hypothetical protein